LQKCYIKGVCDENIINAITMIVNEVAPKVDAFIEDGEKGVILVAELDPNTIRELKVRKNEINFYQPLNLFSFPCTDEVKQSLFVATSNDYSWHSHREYCY
jgi:hypothetical protein